jgi:DNA primase
MSIETPFNRAKSIYLPAFIRGQGLVLKSQGRSFGMDFCPCCKYGEHKGGNKVSVFVAEDGLWRWKCYACNTPPSSAIDFAAAFWGVTAKDAVERINADLNMLPSHPQPYFNVTPEIQENDAAMSEALALIFKSAGKNVATAYLATRGIPAHVVADAFNRKLVCSLSDTPHKNLTFLMEVVGKNLLIDSGFLKRGKTWPAIAFRPVIFPMGKEGAEFRIVESKNPNDAKSIRYGRLNKPWWWRSDVDKVSVMVTEGAIDALSVVTMGWTGHVMSLPGVSSWRQEWFEGIKAKYPNAVFYLGLDNDKPGADATKLISECLDRLGYSYQKYAPPFGKDWNESLMAGHLIKTEQAA